MNERIRRDAFSQRDAIYHAVIERRANFSIADVALDCVHPSTGRLGMQARLIKEFAEMNERIRRDERNNSPRFTKEFAETASTSRTRGPLLPIVTLGFSQSRRILLFISANIAPSTSLTSSSTTSDRHSPDTWHRAGPSSLCRSPTRCPTNCSATVPARHGGEYLPRGHTAVHQTDGPSGAGSALS